MTNVRSGQTIWGTNFKDICDIKGILCEV